MAHGVRIFRVDNPHTKPLWFWERLFADDHATDPDVVFLAEAFTRPPMMRALAEVGFQQSLHLLHLAQRASGSSRSTSASSPGRWRRSCGPNVFVNTPDILPEYLQHGGPAAFAIRAALAATLSPTWGVYSGFELFEHVARATRQRGVPRLGEVPVPPARLGRAPRRAAARSRRTSPGSTTSARRAPGAAGLRSLQFHYTDDDDVIAFSKRDGDDTVLVVVQPRPARGPGDHRAGRTCPRSGMDWHDRSLAHDEVTGQTWTWGQAALRPARPLERRGAHRARPTRLTPCDSRGERRWAGARRTSKPGAQGRGQVG